MPFKGPKTIPSMRHHQYLNNQNNNFILFLFPLYSPELDSVPTKLCLNIGCICFAPSLFHHTQTCQRWIRHHLSRRSWQCRGDEGHITQTLEYQDHCNKLYNRACRGSVTDIQEEKKVLNLEDKKTSWKKCHLTSDCTIRSHLNRIVLVGLGI